MRVRAGIAAVSAVASLSLGSVALAVPVAHGAPMDATAAAAPAEDTVTLRLAPGNAAAYRALVAGAGLTRAERLARLAIARPPDAARRQVERIVAAQGLRVVGESAWTITAAAPARVAAGFVTTAKGRGLTGSDTPLATGPLAGLVTHVLDGRTAHLTMRPRLTPATLDGPSVRHLYGAPVGPAAPRTPLTIATIQFSGWDDDDLGAYATLLGVPDPRSNGQYTAISVLDTDTTAVTFADDAMTEPMDAEVALDQESLLATAPHVKQRAYFAPNTDEGFFTAIEQVASDATDSPDLGIATLSISWGSCEDPSAHALASYNAIDAALQDAAAAGVTVFAASGDNGSLDCGAGTAAAVDFPASDPYTLGVGGTTADANLTTERGWTLSGGGESLLWDRPAYQSALPGSGTGRLVPDLAAVGDPQSGFPVSHRGEISVFGGTSLASPLAAATLTTTLAARGFTSGIGDIHANLYAAPRSSFRDITRGSNGFPAGTGYDKVTGLGAPLWNRLISALDGSPTVKAAAYSRTRTVKVRVASPQGMLYGAWKVSAAAKPTCSSAGSSAKVPTSVRARGDGVATVSVLGLGYNGYCYRTAVTVVVDTVAPVPRPSLTRAGSTVRVAWAGSDGSTGSGVASYRVVVRRSGAATPVYAATRAIAAGITLSGTRGRTYTLTLTVADKAGNTSRVAARSVTL